MKLFTPVAGQTLLDVGSGSGYFSRRLNQLGLNVTGLDSSEEMNAYANAKSKEIPFLQADASKLPFADGSFDYCSAITSLCFVPEPEKALAEMWRVSRHAVILGLLNRNSLLYYMKRDSKGYQDARWDVIQNVRHWVNNLMPPLISRAKLNYRTAIMLPNGGKLSKLIEYMAPAQFPYGGFLAISIEK